jgi:hypothetical protein
MPPRKGERQSPKLDRDLLGFGDTVKVLPYRAPHSGEEGTVRRVRLVAGDLMVEVEFAAKTREEFYETELQRTSAAPKNPRAVWE